ncbi:hypothetical protein [Treponema sp. OMZ 857]|uniref:hypothetical protein n=1 Tax=Treponema sp. OMZ 857 TaxID=1643513 RepID=UPI0020A31D9B|nr:hypothetical protein [Treponema sp. OMZ 857]UTC44627.1 hypothetical protein E4N66_11410 [Treponema sp. OMZ 857]
MKKRIFAIAFVISVIIGLSACKNPPIFAAIEQEVKLNPASVKGFVCGIVEINGTLYASNGKIWYKAKGETGKWSELSGCPSGRCTGLAVSGSDLYAAFGQGDTFTIYWYDTGAKSWTEVSGLTAKAVFGTRVVFAIDSRTSGNTTTYTISSAIESGTPNTWASPTDKAPVGAAGLYCLLEDGLYNNTGTKVIGTDSPSSGLKGICEGPTDSVFVVDNTKLYCYDGNTSTWTNIVHGVSSPQSITYLPSKQLVLISGIKGYGEIKLASATDTNLANAHTVSAGSADSSVPSANIHQYNNSVGKHTINPIYALDYGTGYIIYVGVNDPNAKYTGLWGFYSFGKKEWNRE